MIDIKLKSNEETIVGVNPEVVTEGIKLQGAPTWTVLSGTSATVAAEGDGKTALITAVEDECGPTLIQVKATLLKEESAQSVLQRNQQSDPLRTPPSKDKDKDKDKDEKKDETKAEKAEAKKEEAKEAKTEAARAEVLAEAKSPVRTTADHAELESQIWEPGEPRVYSEVFNIWVDNINPASGLRISLGEPRVKEGEEDEELITVDKTKSREATGEPYKESQKEAQKETEKESAKEQKPNRHLHQESRYSR